MRKFTALLITVLLLSFVWFKFIRDFDSSSLEKVEFDIPDSLTLEVSRGYLIPESQSLTYTLSQSPRRVWISTAAILPGNNNKTAHYPYELAVKVLDKNDEILFSQQFHFQSRIAKLVELNDGGQEVPEVFLASLQNKLGASGNVHVKLPEGATRLLITQSVKSPQIQEVSIRAYQYVQRSSRVDPVALWERLSLKQRKRLTENFPFDDTFISDEEKGNLVEFRWQPLVPLGDEGDDYTSKLLYRIPNAAIAHKKHLLSQYEHHLDAYKRVSFPIETKGLYRLEGNHGFGKRPFTLTMTWFNTNDTWSKTRTFDFDSVDFAIEFELSPGLVTFKSSIPVSVGLFANTGFLEEHDHFSSSILLLPGQMLDYKIEHSGEKGTPIQVQARAFAEQSLTTQANANVTVLETNGDQVLNSHDLHIETIPEENSQLVNEEFFNWLGVANRSYLTVNKNVKKVRLTSNQPVLISVFTRLDTMPAIRVLPEEKRDWFDYAAGVPDWFAMRPQNLAALINQGNIRLLKHYHRSLLAERDLPEPDETYQSLVKDFSNLTLLDLMVENPYPGQPTSLEENKDLNFAPATSATVQYTDTDEQGARPPKRRLFFIKQDKSPQQINWQRHETKQPFFWVAGKWGLVDEIATGGLIDGPISFQHENSQWWRNGVPREEAKWQQRRALLLEAGQGVSVKASKTQDKEIITLVVYTTGESPVTLDLNVYGLNRNPQVSDVHTIVNRQYKIQPKARYKGFQLSGTREIKGRQSFSVVLDRDLLQGEYEVSLSHRQGDEVFISMVKRTLKPVPIIERYRTVGGH